MSAYQFGTWYPIESAPQDGTWILGWHPSTYVEDCIATYRWHTPPCDPPCWIDAADSEPDQPTFWMPLPPPPAKEE